MGNKVENAEAKLHDQTNYLPFRELMIVFSIMSLSLFVCFIDQNGIGVLLPLIAKDLNAQSSISWAGTSALIANTVFQVLYGRLSDLFGRKMVLLSALVLLSLSDLACGLAVNSTMLYVFRGLAGVANGGITSLVMMVVSDVVTLQERGKYQGFLGSFVGLGNAAGPLIAAGFAVYSSWRGLFYLISPLAMVSFICSWIWLPSNMPKLNLKETLAKIDMLGLFFGTAAVIFLLIPISDGGHPDSPWNSPMIIAMFVVGGLCLIAFIMIEWRWAELPMMPLSMFRIKSVAAMLAQSFLLGMAYYSYIYFTISSTLGGLYISKFNRYGEVIWAGFGIWTLGAGLMILANRTISLGLIAFFLVLIGVGTGLTFQPTLVALQAHCPKAQRAVVTSNRNFIRSSGGAVGLAVSSAILANVLKGSLPERLSSVATSTFATPDLTTFSTVDADIIAEAYADASRAVFIFGVPLAGVACLLTGFIKDRGLVRKEEQEAAKSSTFVESGQEDVEKGEPVAVREKQSRSSDEVVVDVSTDMVEDGRKPSLSSRSSEKSGASDGIRGI